MDNKEMNFVAIDFEHVTELQAICQVGYVVFKEGKEVEEKEYLINPLVGDFSDCPATKYVHHIKPEDVANAETFRTFWERFIAQYGNETWVFHNAESDLSALKKNLCHAGICEQVSRIPPYVDTMKLYDERSLKDSMEMYGFKFEERHQALYDAKACAFLYITYLQGDYQYFNEAHPTNQQKIASFKKKKIDHDILQQDLTNADPNHPFYDKKVVITGSLDAYPERNELARMLKDAGADVNTSISSKTDYVIMGKNAGPSKMKKIEELKQNGCPIEVIDEEKLKEMLNQKQE